MKLLKYLLVASTALSLLGCAGNARDVKVTKGEPIVQYADQVEIKYLGAGGHLIRRGKDVLIVEDIIDSGNTLSR